MAEAAKDINTVSDSVMAVMDKAAKQIGRAKEEYASAIMWRACYDGWFESPIEEMFFCSLLAVSKVNAFSTVFERGGEFPSPVEQIRGESNSYDSKPLLVYPQAVIGRYRVDFLLFVDEGPCPCPTVIELDGHEWHERSEPERRKEKKRDRHMQSLGLRVGRYTGSEVYKDPFRVAADALNLAVGVPGHFITAEEYWGD